MNKKANTNYAGNEKIYLRVKKAKADVERFIQDYGEIADPRDFFESSYKTLSPDAKQVIGAGIIFNSKEYGYQFSMPKTSDLVKFLGKKSKAYENGYGKMSVLNDRYDSEFVIDATTNSAIRISSIIRYEVMTEKDAEPKWKDLVGVLPFVIGNDRKEADDLVDKLNDFFDNAFADSPYVTIADFEDANDILIHRPETDSDTRNNYGWSDPPVITARKDNYTGNYTISLPPCSRI